MDKNELGAFGETCASSLLQNSGYHIIERNFKCKTGEIDIIAQQNEYIIFIEVKLRKNMDFGEAREFVTLSKQKKMIRTSEYWMAIHHSSAQPRFDIIEIYAPEGLNTIHPKMNHITNAFGLNY